MPAPYAAYLITQATTLICLHGRAKARAAIVADHDPEDVHFVDSSRTYEGAWAMAASEAGTCWAEGRLAVLLCAAAWHAPAGGTVH